MGFVFVSHASEDKPRVRTLVRSLALLGVRLWIDRPGYGPSHFGFEQSFIEQYRILGIRAGRDYDTEISEALHRCDAVLACLSRALQKSRQILVQELVVAKIQHKLIACVVDDLPFDELPADLGLGDASKIQAQRIDPDALQHAVDKLAKGHDGSTLEGSAKVQWNIVLDLVRQIRHLSPWQPSDEDLSNAVKRLVQFPIFPIVHASDIPLAITAVFDDWFTEPVQAEAFFLRAMTVLKQAKPADCTDDQILLKKGEVLSPLHVSPRNYWDDVLSAAGRKSPRTLAALLITPGAPAPTRPDHAQTLTEFERWLERRN